jgi:hypothetical protein
MESGQKEYKNNGLYYFYMISIHLMGGLGNQLFQIFTTIAYGLEHNMPFGFVYSKMLNERKTYWDDFLVSIKKYTAVIPTKIIASLPVYEERTFSFEKIPIHNHIRIQGYFQSYKYFQNHETQIYELIGLREHQRQMKAEFSEYFSKQPTISIHFRMGDYKHKQYYHPIMPLQYYAKSVQHIAITVDQPLSVLYFCEEEDNEFVQPIVQELQAMFPLSTFTKVNDSIVDWKQLLIMSSCDHQIIANSSFSWFSAYLNENPHKVVCYPSLWFGPGLAHHQLHDLFPETWKKIDL